MQAVPDWQDYVFWGGSYHAPNLSMRSVVTIHDLSHIHYPQFHPKERVVQLNHYLPDVVARADALTVVSEATRQDVLKQFNIDSSKPIHVVSPAVDKRFAEVDEKSLAMVRQQYTLPDQYILSVGTLEPRKNLLTLLAAYALLPEVLQKKFPLILVGGKGWLMEDTEQLLYKFRPKGEVRWLGYVPELDLPTIYFGASLFVYISLFEGFGMPLLEAMATGVPVLTSNRGAMQEVVGDAACCVNPEHDKSVADAIQYALSDVDQRMKWSVKGKNQATQYTWENSAVQLLDILHH